MGPNRKRAVQKPGTLKSCSKENDSRTKHLRLLAIKSKGTEASPSRVTLNSTGSLIQSQDAVESGKSCLKEQVWGEFIF